MRRWIVGLAAVALAGACSDGDRQVVAATRGPSAQHAHAPLAADTAIASSSIYNLTGEWWDARGERAPLERLAGRPQVVALVYTSCAQACPAIVAELKRIEANLGDDASDVGFVLASMDPERDSPERLAEFARRAALDPGRRAASSAREREG